MKPVSLVWWDQGYQFLRGLQMFLFRRSFPYRLFALISASTSWNQSRGSGCRYGAQYRYAELRWTIKFYYHTLFYFKWLLLSLPGENAIHFSSVTLVECVCYNKLSWPKNSVWNTRKFRCFLLLIVKTINLKVLSKAKGNACSKSLVSSRKILVKEILEIFQRDPQRSLPVMANVVRAVQRKKNSRFIWKTLLYFTLNGVKILLNCIHGV
jgi:hypothetical protein